MPSWVNAVETKRLSKEEIANVLDGMLASDVTLITDKHPSYKTFAKDIPSLKHKALRAKDHVEKKGQDPTVAKSKQHPWSIKEVLAALQWC